MTQQFGQVQFVGVIDLKCEFEFALIPLFIILRRSRPAAIENVSGLPKLLGKPNSERLLILIEAPNTINYT